MLKTTVALTIGKKGDVALPKTWLRKQKEKTFIAEENIAGHLVLRSIPRVKYYERKNGDFGLHFPDGIAAADFLLLLTQAHKTLLRKEAKQKNKGIYK